MGACNKKSEKLEETPIIPVTDLPKWTLPSGFSDHISISGQNVLASKIRTDGQGNVVVAWIQSNGTNKMVYKSEYRNGTWTHPSSLTDSISKTGQDVVELELVVGKNTNMYVGAYW